MPSNSFVWPRCFKCQRPAHRVDQENSPDSRDVIFTVYCHGEVEVARLQYHMLVGGEVDVIGLGEVFRPNLLEKS